MQIGMITCLSIVGASSMALAGLLGSSERTPPRADYQVKHDPLTVAVSTVGRFGKGYSWYLSVNSAGKAELTIDTVPDRTYRQFEVSNEQFAALRKSLLSERFFQLEDAYGKNVPDGSTKTITVTAGHQSKTVKLQHLMSWIDNEDDKHKLREPARALRVLLLIRDWFDDPAAVDLRRYERMVIEAAQQ